MRRGVQHQTAMLAVLMGFCLASAGSGCCLALTGQAFDPSDNGCKPAEAHPCLDGLKGLLWPWGRNREPSYSQFHPVPCSPALTPRSAFASGGELPGLVALPPPARRRRRRCRRKACHGWRRRNRRKSPRQWGRLHKPLSGRPAAPATRHRRNQGGQMMVFRQRLRQLGFSVCPSSRSRQRTRPMAGRPQGQIVPCVRDIATCLALPFFSDWQPYGCDAPLRV